MAKEKNSPPSGEFNEIEKELRVYSTELEAEFEEIKRECRLAEEKALLRLSEMEKETLKQVGEEWHSREEALALLSEEMDREILSLEKKLSGDPAEEDRLKALLDEAFATLLGEKAP